MFILKSIKAVTRYWSNKVFYKIKFKLFGGWL